MPIDVTQLNERGQQLLKTLVERYIADGTPVGSRKLARASGLELSPATIRNVMVDLEEMGLVTAPHTSAGRVPTETGYRVFVDSLVTCQPLRDEIITRLKHDFRGSEGDPVQLRDRASSMLSGLTHLAGLVMTPGSGHTGFRQIEFLPLSGNRILVILVTDQQDVLNRIIQTDRAYSAAELEQAANFLNATYAGRDLDGMREALLKDLTTLRERLDERMVEIIAKAHQVIEAERPRGGDYVLAGQTNLMQQNQNAELDQLRELFDAFAEKQQILHLLERCAGASGVTVFIGEESEYKPLGGFSVVAKPFTVDGEVVGVLGVVGPTRMAYDRVIPVVDVTARLLGTALKPA